MVLLCVSPRPLQSSGGCDPGNRPSVCFVQLSDKVVCAKLTGAQMDVCLFPREKPLLLAGEAALPGAQRDKQAAYRTNIDSSLD